MSVVIIDYGSGNLRSAEKAVERVARERGLSVDICVSSQAEDVLQADHIILPGVGAFGDCMAGLRALPGMVEALEETILKKGRPFLGICVGMQLMAEQGYEHGIHQGLGWIDGVIRPIIITDDMSLKIPHMGWNQLKMKPCHNAQTSHPVLQGINPGDHAYFVHSFHFVPTDSAQVLASVDYGGDIAAIVGRDNIIGTQFHPEKSQQVGLDLMGNFLEWRP